MISNLCSEENYNCSGNSDMTDYDSCEELSSSDFECLDKNEDTNDKTLYNTAKKSNSALELIIASWAIRHNITHSALDDLLINLSKCSQFSHLQWRLEFLKL